MKNIAIKITVAVIAIAVGIYGIAGCLDPTMWRLTPTVPNPSPPPSPAPDTWVVDPLGQDWKPGNYVPWDIALPLARIAKATYDGPDALRSTLAEWGFTEFTPIQHDTMYVVVASNDEALVIAFRGTNPTEIEDWIVDADARPILTAHGNIHSGFYRTMQSMKPSIDKALKTHGADRKHVWIAGHSLGGALAVCYAYGHMLNGTLEPKGIFTFGQPKVAGGSLASYLNGRAQGRYIRFVNGADVVARIPPFYSHFGDLAFYDGVRIQFDHPEPLFGAAEADISALQYETGFRDLTKEEYETLKQSIRAARSRRQRRRDERRERRNGPEPKVGSPAWVLDHKMDAYIGWIVDASNASRMSAP